MQLATCNQTIKMAAEKIRSASRGDTAEEEEIIQGTTEDRG